MFVAIVLHNRTTGLILRFVKLALFLKEEKKGEGNPTLSQGGYHEIKHQGQG
jgi:hypothetical protein